MPLRSQENSIGAWAFLAGVILAFIVGISTTLLPIPALIKISAQMYAALFILGIVIGYFIPAGRDSQTFLITAAILVIVSKFGMESATGSLLGIGLGDAVISTFSGFLALFVPATIIVALKTVFNLARV